jgi:hypothetical protein
MAENDETVGFNLQAAKRVARATQIVERAYRLPPLDRYATPNQSEPGIRPAKTGAGGITAMSGDMPGSGDVTLYGFNGTDPLESTGVTTTAYNLGGAVAGNKWVNVCGGSAGWWVVVEPC